MCSVVVLPRPGHAWPLLIAANRDEMLERPCDPPGAHWPDRADVVAGRDRSGGGTWLGVNTYGVVAAVLNRAGSLGPAPGKRSRGELPLLALEHATAAEASAALCDLDARAYRSFNMVIADIDSAYFLRGLGSGRLHAASLSPGAVHMVTAHDPDDLSSPRVARHLPRLAAAPVPQPPEDWAAWREILLDTSGPIEAQLHVTAHAGFGTVSTSFLALPAQGAAVWWYLENRLETPRRVP